MPQPDAVEQESRTVGSPPAGVNGGVSPEAPAERRVPDNHPLHEAVGICVTCGELVLPGVDGCPNNDFSGPVPDRHTVRWFQRPVPDLTYAKREGQLRRPFTKEAVKWRVLRGSQVIAYVDVRVVIERLNLVVAGLWQEETEVLPSGLLLCRLTIDGQTHEDVGEHTNKKGLYSDALKRAAVRFGVGVSVYAIPSLEMPLGSEYGKKREVEDLDGNTLEVGPYVVRRQRGDGMDLTAEGHRGLRWFYQRWLDKTGIARFGEPIDHGDVEDSAGESVTPDEEAATSDLPDVAMPLTDEKADELRAACRAAYATVPKRELPKARFDAELRQASVSHDGLEALRARLAEMAK